MDLQSKMFSSCMMMMNVRRKSFKILEGMAQSGNL